MSKHFTRPFNPINWQADPIDHTSDSPDHPYLGIYTKDATQRYVLGTRYITWDGRVFKYGKAAATMKTDLMCWQTRYQAIVQWAQFPTAHAIGANPVNITTSSDDGIAYDGVFTEDELAGGYIVLFWGGSSTGGTYGIVGNDARATAGDMAVYLDHPNRFPITKATGSAEGMFSPYYDVSSANASGSRSFRGVPMAPATTTYPYHWIQSWGPTHIATPDASVGAGAYDWEVVARHDGSVENASTTALQMQQHVGHTLILDYDSGAISQASPFIMLKISI